MRSTQDDAGLLQGHYGCCTARNSSDMLTHKVIRLSPSFHRARTAWKLPLVMASWYYGMCMNPQCSSQANLAFTEQ
eukprot:6457749-Amphidinium_carterae.1